MHTIAKEAIEIIIESGPYYSAKQMHRQLQSEFRKHGFKTKREVPVKYCDKQGYIDLVIEKYDYVISLELDFKSPRKKSIKKLVSYDSDFRICALRVGQSSFIEDGILVIPVASKPWFPLPEEYKELDQNFMQWQKYRRAKGLKTWRKATYDKVLSKAKRLSLSSARIQENIHKAIRNEESTFL